MTREEMIEQLRQAKEQSDRIPQWAKRRMPYIESVLKEQREETMIEFKPFPKVPRLNREMVITEKIDGTNGAITIVPVKGLKTLAGAVMVVGDHAVYAQSRKRFVTLDKDNHGFAKWVAANAEGLVSILGTGTHFGEFWGSGVNYGYNLPKGEKRFSLFNVSKWGEADLSAVPGLDIVPVLYRGQFKTDVIDMVVDAMRKDGSVASPGAKAEGVIVFHVAANSMFKVLCENDSIPKGLTE